jgi:hypothetical protein
MTSKAIETIEVPWQEGARVMDDCAYLFATDVRELEELTLGLTIVEAKLQAPIASTDESDPLGLLKIGARPIQEDQTCRIFHVVFDRNHLISYTVLNESYGKYPEPPEAFTGKTLPTLLSVSLTRFHRTDDLRLPGAPSTSDALRNSMLEPCD